jgi:hypothetical protein
VIKHLPAAIPDTISLGKILTSTDTQMKSLRYLI